MTTSADAKCRATALQLHGLLAHWAECVDAPWLDAVLNWEETERARRSLECCLSRYLVIHRHVYVGVYHREIGERGEVMR